jgi:hypothetical protein
MQVVIQQGKPAALNREDADKFLEPILEPQFSMFASWPAEKGAAHAPGDAMIPGRHRHIDKLRTKSKIGCA